MTDREEAAEHLAMAETTLALYQGLELSTDEAALLRGCLSALVAIGRHLTRDPEPAPAVEPEWGPCGRCCSPSTNAAHRKACRGIVAHPA